MLELLSLPQRHNAHRRCSSSSLRRHGRAGAQIIDVFHLQAAQSWPTLRAARTTSRRCGGRRLRAARARASRTKEFRRSARRVLQYEPGGNAGVFFEDRVTVMYTMQQPPPPVGRPKPHHARDRCRKNSSRADRQRRNTDRPRRPGIAFTRHCGPTAHGLSSISRRY